MRRCGQGKHECVVFLVGQANDGHLEVVHPAHAARAGGYEVSSNWLGQFAVRQTEEPLFIRAQIHTHPGSAYHSSIDDEWPVVGTAGFTSIVVPRFAQGTIRPSEIYACRLTSKGAWEALNPTSLFAA
jgi:hypothetical protein